MKGFQPDPTAIRPPTDLTARRAYNDLRRRILTAELAQGDVVNEVAMADQLNISRTPMREVFRELLNEGLLAGDGPRRQVRVRSLSPALLDEVFAARTALEAIVAGAAAENAGSQEVDELVLIAARLAAAAHERNVARFLDLDEEFDLALSRIAHSTITEGFLRRLRALSRLALVTSTPSRGLLDDIHRSRVGMIAALREADVSAAVVAAATHLRVTAAWSADSNLP